MLPSLDFTDVSTPGIYLIECGYYLFSLDYDGNGEWFIPTIWFDTECVVRRDIITDPYNVI